MIKEEFRDIPNYDGLYQVSNLGRVKSLLKRATNGRIVKECILKPSISNNGYLRVTLCVGYERHYKTIHQLSAMTFLNHNLDGTQKLVVNHIDFNKLNNKVNNLEIVTNRVNSNRKHIKSTSEYIGVSWQKSSNKWHSQININGRSRSIGLFKNEIDAHNAYQNKLKTIL